MPILSKKAQLIDDIHDADDDKTLTEKDNYIYDLIEDFVNENSLEKRQRVNDLLSAIQEDHNLVSSTVIKKLITAGIINEYNLSDIGIDEVFIRTLAENLNREDYPTPNGDLSKVSNTSTEVYFWGIPASGKTCAIGALLTMAFKSDLPQLKDFEEGKCQGKEYMMKLCEMFPYDKNESTEVMPLPSGTPVKYTYEMFFNLTDKKGQVYPITFIDMAGELVRCMYKKNKGEKLLAEEEKALQTVTNVLKDNRTGNQKLHFFVLEYKGENRRFGGVSQTQYLRGAINYLSNIDDGDGKRFNVFKDKTDGIYLLVTQVDKAGKSDKELKDHMKKYMTGPESYNSVANRLKQICENNHINGGKLAIIMFSLGDVCFKDYCLFSPRFTCNAFNILLSHMYSYNEILKIPLIKKIYNWLTNNG